MNRKPNYNYSNETCFSFGYTIDKEILKEPGFFLPPEIRYMIYEYLSFKKLIELFEVGINIKRSLLYKKFYENVKKRSIQYRNKYMLQQIINLTDCKYFMSYIKILYNNKYFLRLKMDKYSIIFKKCPNPINMIKFIIWICIQIQD